MIQTELGKLNLKCVYKKSKNLVMIITILYFHSKIILHERRI